MAGRRVGEIWFIKERSEISDGLDSDLPEGFHGHPAVVVSTQDHPAKYTMAAITSLGEKPLSKVPKKEWNRYIPIHDSPTHPNDDFMLYLTMDRRMNKQSYVKPEPTALVSLSIMTKYHRFRGEKKDYFMCPRSCEILKERCSAPPKNRPRIPKHNRRRARGSMSKGGTRPRSAGPASKSEAGLPPDHSTANPESAVQRDEASTGDNAVEGDPGHNTGHSESLPEILDSQPSEIPYLAIDRLDSPPWPLDDQNEKVQIAESTLAPTGDDQVAEDEDQLITASSVDQTQQPGEDKPEARMDTGLGVDAGPVAMRADPPGDQVFSEPSPESRGQNEDPAQSEQSNESLVASLSSMMDTCLVI